MTPLVLLLPLALASQAPASDEGAPDATAPLLEELAPITEAAPVPDEEPAPLPPQLPTMPEDAPATPQAAAPPSTGELPPPDAEAPTEWPTGWIQYGTETATSCVCCGCPGAFGMVAIPISAVVFWIPYVGLISSLVVLAAPSCLGCAGFVISPLVGAGLGVILADWLGTTRGTLGWPVLAGYASELAASAVMTVGVVVLAGFSTVFAFSTLNPGFEFTNPTSGEPVFRNWQEWDFNSLGIGSAASFALLAGGLVAAVFAPPVASTLSYELLADEKAPDDTSFRFPGFFSPNPLTDEEREEERLEAERDALDTKEQLRIQDKKQDEWKKKQKERELEKQKENEKEKGKGKARDPNPLPVSFPIRY